MNIAFFTDTFIPQVNGVANTVYRSAQTLSNLGHNVCIYTISKNSNKELNALTGEKIKVFTLPSIKALAYRGERLALPLGLSIKNMKKFKPDIIHTHTPFSIGWEAIWCAKKLKIPLVGTHHTFFDHYLKYIYLDYKWAKNLTWKGTVMYYNYCDLVISPTQSLANGLKTNNLKKNIEIVPNPVDINKFCPPKNEDEKNKLKLSLQIKGKSLVYVGRIGYEKSIAQVIKAVSIVVKEIKDIKFLIIGDGPEKNNLIKLTRDLGLQNNVIFTGFIYGDDLVRALQASDIFLLGSKSENMPLAVLEAMAVGLPIVSVSSLGMIEIVKDRQNGFLLSPDNPEEMAEKIMELLGDDSLLNNFSKKSRELSFLYGEERSAKKLLEIYEKLI